jgi:hypothetical protein
LTRLQRLGWIKLSYRPIVDIELPLSMQEGKLLYGQVNQWRKEFKRAE